MPDRAIAAGRAHLYIIPRKFTQLADPAYHPSLSSGSPLATRHEVLSRPVLLSTSERDPLRRQQASRRQEAPYCAPGVLHENKGRGSCRRITMFAPALPDAEVPVAVDGCLVWSLGCLSGVRFGAGVRCCDVLLGSSWARRRARLGPLDTSHIHVYLWYPRFCSDTPWRVKVWIDLVDAGVQGC